MSTFYGSRGGQPSFPSQANAFSSKPNKSNLPNNNIRLNISNTGINANRPRTIKSYKSIFEKVFYNRMKFYHRLSAVLALIITILLYIPSKSNAIFIPVKFILLWTGYTFFQQARISSLTIESSKASNLIQKIVSLFCSKKSYILGGTILLNNLLVSLILYAQSDSSLNYYIETPTKTIKPFVNDNFAFFVFFTIASSIIYSLNYIMSEKFLLQIPMGTYRQEPISYLKKLPHLKLLVLTTLKSIFAFFVIPLTYHVFFRDIFFQTFLKPLVLFNDLNNQLPRSDFSFKLLFKLSFYFWIESLSYDLLNEFFKAYALVGCLVVKTPISHFSDTPFQTLLSGIKDYENSIVRLTAYQELVYLSTSTDFKDRQVFYRADNWNLILAEFFFVQTNAARSARADLPKLKSTDNLKKDRLEGIKKQASIFGNQSKDKKSFDFDFDFEINEEEKKADADVTVVKNDSDAIYTKPEPKAEQISEFEIQYNTAVTSLYTFMDGLKNRIQRYVKNYLNIQSHSLGDTTEANSITYQLDVLYADFSSFTRHLFFGDIIEQSNKRIPNKEIVGFSIIALTEMLIHAKVEDKYNTVTGTLTESLTLLTKVYKGTSEFLNNPPAGLSGKRECSIMVINELTISYFFKLVIYYNNILNDLLLPPEVFKLAKWCTDMALEQQREQKFTTNILQ